MKVEFSPTHKFVSSGELKVDLPSESNPTGYQRPLDEAWVSRLEKEFDPDGFGYVHVSERKDGSFWILDGQHKTAALRRWFKDGDVQRVPCIVYHGMTIRDEARKFHALNHQRVMHPFYDFRARVVAKEKVAVAIVSIVEGAGFPLTSVRGDSLSCVAALERVYRGCRSRNKATGPATLKTVLDTTAETWGTKSPYPHGEFINGFGIFAERYGDELDFPVLRRKLAEFSGGWLGIVGKGRRFREVNGGTVATGIAETLRTTYNKGKRTTALSDFQGRT